MHCTILEFYDIPTRGPAVLVVSCLVSISVAEKASLASAIVVKAQLHHPHATLISGYLFHFHPVDQRWVLGETCQLSICIADTFHLYS